MRILIVKMWALGDILMATPLLRALKKSDPDCEITWFVEKAQAPILEDNSLIDELIPFDSASWRRDYRYGRIGPYLKTSLAMRKMLLNRNFDIVINLTAEKWWSMWFTVAPKRIGLFPRPNPGLIGRVYTLTIPRTREPFIHNTQHYLLCADALGIEGPHDERMVVGISDKHREEVDRFLNASPYFDPSFKTVVLHPGTSQSSKCWPISHYAQLARQLLGFNIVVTGSPSERHLAEAIAADSDVPVIIASGELSHIGHTAALVDLAAAVVTGDTSILHIASALDTPLVGIYGSTRPRDNAPLFGRSELLYDDSVSCSPCYKSKCPLSGAKFMACMNGVTVDAVICALERLEVKPISESSTTALTAAAR